MFCLRREYSGVSGDLSYLAVMMTTEPSKQIMLRIAHDYERLPKRPEDNLRNATGGRAQFGERA
jgi:hypothetical protein